MYRYEDVEQIFPYGESEVGDKIIKIHFIRIPFVFEKDKEKVINQQITQMIYSILDINDTK